MTDAQRHWLCLILSLKAEHAKAHLEEKPERAPYIERAIEVINDVGEGLGWDYTESIKEVLTEMAERREAYEE